MSLVNHVISQWLNDQAVVKKLICYIHPDADPEVCIVCVHISFVIIAVLMIRAENCLDICVPVVNLSGQIWFGQSNPKVG